ncbi:group III truncated hemoglobin [Catalinimonas niigatensis]|uniref:group III truncated hemoglobin n=1 Tax=Catalinimonas niigatensis TaxID=1397264 RepID=UPI00266570BB|nr:group III truncated hemoglobin [Catalinimonas niigatensis]WPP51958.1 group III truncated hemoglobin [Catalinimonas niigatensis]
MNTKNSIAHLEDIKLLVDSFYGKVRDDDLLAPIFNDRMGNRWPEHLEKMYKFWQTVLLDEHTYYGSPFLPHAHLEVDKTHFERWLTLFYATVEEHFMGEKAEEAKWRANKMAEMFLYKIEYYRDNPKRPIL